MKRFFLLLSFLMMLFTEFAAAQSAIPDSGNIEYKFDYIIENSNRYQEYRVVRMTWLEQMKDIVDDSLQVIRKNLADTRAVVDAQQNEISGLQTELASINEQLTAVSEEKDNFMFMGTAMSKAGFLTLFWVVVAILSVLLLLFMVMYNSSNAKTRHTQKTLRDTSEEFDLYKKRAMEKEQLLKRELQDELNKRN